MAKKDPFNIALLDIDKVIREEHIQEVTSEFIKESSTNRFHPQGLFSEQIFGDIASQKRLETCGFIRLNCRVFHPIVYQNLQAIKRFYTEIMAGNAYAVWDAHEGDFVRASESEEGADTGYSFFMKHFEQINFNKNKSLKRNDKIDVITKFKAQRIIDKVIVIPAGCRDLKEDGARAEKDSINSIYASLLRNARSMTKGADTNALFDSVHYTIQKRVIEIYEKIAEMVRGKRGFFEGKFSHRNIARGTRNVVTASDMDASDPDSPQYHRCDETKVPLFQASKAGANYLVYWFKTLFYDQIVNMSSENVPLIDPKTLNLEYVSLETKDKDRMMTAEGIEKTIDRFRDPFNRFKPVTAQSNGKTYYLFMVYDRGDRIHIIRNVAEFKQMCMTDNVPFDEKKIRPLTHAEMLYIACYSAYVGKHTTVTRYPVNDEQSIFVSKVHLMTTSPARVVRLCRYPKDSPEDLVLPEYPIEGKKFVDAMMLHPTRLKSLNADFDGNCLVGETRVEIRYTTAWFNTVCSLLSNKNYYNPGIEGFSDQVLPFTMNRIDNRIYAVQDGWNYAEVQLQDLPQLGRFVLDRNGARVYDMPSGLEVFSYSQGSGTYLPVEKITVEDNCNVATVSVMGRQATVSTNPSLAVFSHVTGELNKVSPGQLKDGYIPVIRKSIQFPNVCPDLHKEDGYTEGFNLPSVESVMPLYLRGFTREYQIGYLSGVIERFGRVERSNTLLGIDISIHADTEAGIENLKRLCYTVGFRYILPSCTHGFEIRLNCTDILKRQKEFFFKDKRHSDLMRNWRPSRRMASSDPIPVTKKEKSVLGTLAVQRHNYDDAQLFARARLAIDRDVLRKYVKPGDDPLAQRVYNEDVCWGTGGVKRHTEKRRVYDLIVPGSKVFAVNDGMVVFDTCSLIPIFSDEANKECDDYIHQPGNYVLPSGEPLADMCDDLVKISMYAMTRDTPELKK